MEIINVFEKKMTLHRSLTWWVEPRKPSEAINVRHKLSYHHPGEPNIEELGKDLQRSRERIRQIMKKFSGGGRSD